MLKKRGVSLQVRGRLCMCVGSARGAAAGKAHARTLRVSDWTEPPHLLQACSHACVAGSAARASRQVLRTLRTRKRAAGRTLEVCARMADEIPSAEFVIIGAGVFGLSTALHLARRGHSVAVFEAHGIPAEDEPAENLLPGKVYPGTSVGVSRVVRAGGCRADCFAAVH